MLGFVVFRFFFLNLYFIFQRKIFFYLKFFCQNTPVHFLPISQGKKMIGSKWKVDSSLPYFSISTEQRISFSSSLLPHPLFFLSLLLVSKVSNTQSASIFYLFEYLTILSNIYSPFVSHTPSYYKKEFHRSSPKILTRNFKLNIS